MLKLKQIEKNKVTCNIYTFVLCISFLYNHLLIAMEWKKKMSWKTIITLLSWTNECIVRKIATSKSNHSPENKVKRWIASLWRRGQHSSTRAKSKALSLVLGGTREASMLAYFQININLFVHLRFHTKVQFHTELIDFRSIIRIPLILPQMGTFLCHGSQRTEILQ